MRSLTLSTSPPPPPHIILHTSRYPLVRLQHVPLYVCTYVLKHHKPSAPGVAITAPHISCSQSDLCAGVRCRRHCSGRGATVSARSAHAAPAAAARSLAGCPSRCSRQPPSGTARRPSHDPQTWCQHTPACTVCQVDSKK